MNIRKKYPSFRFTIYEQTSGVALTLIPFGIGINLAIGELIALLKIPLYLDSMGTIFISATCGVYAGIVCGILSNLVAGFLFNPTMVFFAPVSVVVAIFSAFAGRHNAFQSVRRAIPFGIFQGVLTAFVSAPIAAFVFGGVTLGGTDFIVLYFRAVGNTLLDSVLYQGLASDPADKTVSYILVTLFLQRIPSRIRHRLPNAIA